MTIKKKNYNELPDMYLCTGELLKLKGPKSGHKWLDDSGFTMLVGPNYVIDAQQETGRIGRLVSHARGKMQGENCRLKILKAQGGPRVAILAMHAIPIGTLLAYDYGERRPSAMSANPWLKGNNLVTLCKLHEHYSHTDDTKVYIPSNTSKFHTRIHGVRVFCLKIHGVFSYFYPMVETRLG